MKKIIATALSAIMLTSSMTAMAESVSTSYFVDGAISVAGKTTTEVTSIDTGIPGITLNLGADTWTYKDDAKSYNGITYIGRIYGANNPKPAEGVGTYYEFVCDDTVAQGELEVMYQLNAGKAFFIEDNGTALPDFNGITVAEKATQSSSFTVNPGHTYRVYASGTKLGYYGCTYRIIDREADFKAEIANFPFDTIKGDNADENTIDSNLALIDNYESKFGACDVRWISSNESVINNGGEVNAAKEETVVEFTGIFTVQEDDTLAASKTFTLTVPADADDATAVAAAAEALTLGDTSAVKKDLTLPLSGKKGTTISWASKDEAVISIVDDKAVITRYPGQDKTVTLTATVSRGKESTTKDFKVTVLGYVPVTLDTYVYGNADGATCFTPVDGGTLKRISFTSSIKTPVEGDVVKVVICGADGTEKASKEIAITADNYDVSTSAVVDLAMGATDFFKVIALNTVSSEVYIEATVKNEPVAAGAKIFVVGDSTASVYNDNNYPRKGWAQLLGNYFDDVEIVDYALSGRSSLSFKKEANYTKLQNEIKAGDYLIVQFGHNDSKVGEADRYTDPKTDRFTDGSFKKSMLEYINLARDKGAYPILATSISRRKTSDSGLEAYVNAAKELGEEVDVPVLDLYDRTVSWINEVGLEEAKSMFNYVKAKDSRFIGYAGFASSSYYAAGTTDDTHININGADIISQWATEELAEIAHPLAAKVNDYKAVYPLPSYTTATETDGTVTSTPTPSPTPSPTPTPTPSPSADPSPSTDPTAPPVADAIAQADKTVTVTLADVTEAVLVHAVYADGRLVKVDTTPLTFTDGVATVTKDDLANGDKLMVWDSIAGMKALANTAEVAGIVYTAPTDDPTIADTVLWKATESVAANTIVAENLEVMWDATYTEFTVSEEDPTPTTKVIGGIVFTGYISHSSLNGSWGDSAATGSAMKYTATQNGVLKVYFTGVGDGKEAVIAPEGVSKTEAKELAVKGQAKDMVLEANVEAGTTYYITILGSKGRFCGVAFTTEGTASTPEPTAPPTLNIPDPLPASWSVSEAYCKCAEGSELMYGLYTMFDNSNLDGQYISSGSDGKLVGGVATGTALKYVAPANGTLSVSFKDLGSADSASGKTIYIVEEGGSQSSPLASVSDDSETSKITGDITAEVEKGKTYYIYGAGTKARFTGASLTTNEEIERPIVVESVRWAVSANDNECPAGTELIPGLTTLFANTATNGKYITSDDNGSWSNGVAMGTALKYVASANGTLEVSFIDLGVATIDEEDGVTIKTKSIYIAEEGAEKDTVLAVKTNESMEDKLDDTISTEVEAGKTYYIYGAGTKARFTAAKFEAAK